MEGRMSYVTNYCVAFSQFGDDFDLCGLDCRCRFDYRSFDSREKAGKILLRMRLLGVCYERKLSQSAIKR